MSNNIFSIPFKLEEAESNSRGGIAILNLYIETSNDLKFSKDMEDKLRALLHKASKRRLELGKKNPKNFQPSHE